VELIVGLVVAVCAVGVVVAAKAGAERARREREERWARVAGSIPGAPGGAPGSAAALAHVPAAASSPPHMAGGAPGPAPGAPTRVAGASPPAAGAPVSRAARLRRSEAGGPPATRRRFLRGGDASTGQARTAALRPRPAAAPIDVNAAPVEELRTLPGVGVRAAERIVAHREQHGPFPSLAALEAVEGFDQARVSRLAPRAAAGDPT
jgi:competence protein ComEA